ncbi:MAG TPA: cyclase family protein [Woeseiaceae bacterium]|nr:cyclase family protein [Woeseiaceae bacterium]
MLSDIKKSIFILLTIAAVSIVAGCARTETAAGNDELAVTQQSSSLVRTAPWPAGDEKGMGNTIGAGTWMRCAYYMQQPGAKSYELSHVRSNDMTQSPFGVPLTYDYRPTVGIPGTKHAFNGEQIASGEPGAQGTQMDALGHFAYLDKVWDGADQSAFNSAQYYGGYKQSDVKPSPDSPLQKLGIENAPPIVTSAILLDARTYLGGGSALAPGQRITKQDIEDMMKAQGLAERGLLPGDVLYIYTGWSDIWDSDEYYTKGPGLSYDAALYLAEKNIVLVALDNPFTDPVNEGQLAGKADAPEGTPEGLPFAIHHQNLANSGIYQIQNMKLDELAKDKVWTSCTMILPLRSKGNSGSPIRPVAIGRPHDG